MKTSKGRFFAELKPLLETSADPRLAELGIKRLKRGYRVTLYATYSSQSLDQEWEINDSDDEMLVIRLREEGFDTVHKVLWEFYRGMTIEILHADVANSHETSESLFTNVSTI